MQKLFAPTKYTFQDVESLIDGEKIDILKTPRNIFNFYIKKLFENWAYKYFFELIEGNDIHQVSRHARLPLVIDRDLLWCCGRGRSINDYFLSYEFSFVRSA